MATFSLKHGGVWKAPTKLFVKHAGVWQEPVGAWLKSSGTWQRFVPLDPTQTLNLSLTSALDSRVTFARAGSGTYTDSTGVLQTAAANVPRFDHDPITLAPRGLVVEEQRTNLVRFSGEISNAALDNFCQRHGYDQSYCGEWHCARWHQ